MTATTSTLPIRPRTGRASAISFAAGLVVAASTFLVADAVRDDGSSATPAAAAPAAAASAAAGRGGLTMSPDASERWLAGDRDPRGAGLSPDAAERWLGE